MNEVRGSLGDVSRSGGVVLADQARSLSVGGILEGVFDAVAQVAGGDFCQFTGISGSISGAAPGRRPDGVAIIREIRVPDDRISQ